jgi:hypothetical protein
MQLNLSNPAHTTQITQNAHISEPVRGFFRVDYAFSDTPNLEPSGDFRRITARRSGKVLDVPGVSRDNGIAVQRLIQQAGVPNTTGPGTLPFWTIVHQAQPGLC